MRTTHDLIGISNDHQPPLNRPLDSFSVALGELIIRTPGRMEGKLCDAHKLIHVAEKIFPRFLSEIRHGTGIEVWNILQLRQLVDGILTSAVDPIVS